MIQFASRLNYDNKFRYLILQVPIDGRAKFGNNAIAANKLILLIDKI